MRAVIHEQLRLHIDAAKERISAICLSEEVPYTQNEHYFFAYRNKLINQYKTLLGQSRGQARVEYILGSYNPQERGIRTKKPDWWSNINTILSKLAGLGIHGVQAKDLAKLLPEDPMEPGVEIMAEVRAYFQG